jgi:hypothetical protein
MACDGTPQQCAEIVRQNIEAIREGEWELFWAYTGAQAFRVGRWGWNGFKAWRAARAASAAARGASTVLGRTSAHLASKFKHAKDFGVAGNYSKANAAEFSRAIHQHVNNPAVRAIQGTYHKVPVTHYVHPASGLNVIADAGGNFVSGWKLGAEQLENVLTHGGV